jgi:ABC-2 type transport system ATP-binding protein
MKALAAEGRTVFVSSHLMNEMAVTADHLIVIGRGKLIADCSTQEFIARSAEQSVLVRTPDPDRLAAAITAAGGNVRAADHSAAEPGGPPADAATALTVTGLPAARIGELAAAGSVVLHELTRRVGSLEEAFMELTADSVEYGQPGQRAGAGQPGQPAVSGQAAGPAVAGSAPGGQDR